ncbi:MAG TPA: hypothetical protein VJA85_02095 [Candidatus Limnocylindria bacterium]|nr:hypothetical protein [Candidatus Limnocylindria bacterium]
MTSPYRPPVRRDAVARLARGIDEFMSWFMYGTETWPVALIKGGAFFLFMLFVLGHIPNLFYLLTTVYVFQFTKDVGFLVANIVGGTDLVILIGQLLWAQASRGRHGFAWSLIRLLVLLQLLAALLLAIPFMTFALAGGSLYPPVFTLYALGGAATTAGMGAAALVYLWFEYRRAVARDAQAATAAATAFSAGR